ncbi:hypothetical protein LguiB_027285 [Lonicera macranthoides]
MTAYAFSLLQCDGTEDLLDKVWVVQLRVCCNIFVGRLASLKEKLQKQMGSITWDNIILQAHSENVNLSSSTYLLPDSNSLHYLNYGAAVSEIELGSNSFYTTLSIGGQAKTLMFIQLNLDAECYSESLSTLKFAEGVWY